MKSDDSRPRTGDPARHKTGFAAGGAVGAVAGAVVGSVAGPVGTVVGAMSGGALGGAVGDDVAELINPEEEEAYWRSNYSSRPYVKKGEAYGAYSPAYSTGYNGYGEFGTKGQSFEQAEPTLRKRYESSSGQIDSWDRVKSASRDAWNRIEDRIPGDSDADGH